MSVVERRPTPLSSTGHVSRDTVSVFGKVTKLSKLFFVGGGGLIWEERAYLTWQTWMVSVLHKELEYKLKNLKFEIMQLRIKTQSERPVVE